MKRRDFIWNAGVLGAAACLPSLNLSANSRSKKRKALVISTWAPNVKANAAAWEVLMAQGTALDAVHTGVQVPESDPEDTSVGYGGFPDRDGNVTLDACIMDHQGNIGSVMALEHILHPISVARLVMEKTPHVQLVGEGALQFALQQGFKKENLLTAKAEEAWKTWLEKSEYDPLLTIKELQKAGLNNHDTIGMIALDMHGNVSGACTTSGMAFKMRGRIGDSPIIGAGLYVDNEVGAATATGLGEEVVRICGSHTIVEAMRYGYSPEEACKLALERLVRMKGEAHAREVQIGFVAINKQGEYGHYGMTPGVTVALQDADGAWTEEAKSLF
ncbi:MAG: N(4)-(beta-N-acetylglucosaminyl)-L-asparaginase [Chitinophagaceae bacterium]